jgi:hypothetical protein
MAKSSKIPYQHTFTADRGTALRVARALWKETARSLYPILALCFAVIIAAVALTAKSPIDFGIGAILLAAIFMILVPILRNRTVRRFVKACATWAGPGEVIESGFGTDSLAVRTCEADLQIDYSVFTKVSVHDEIVVLKQGKQRTYTALPLSLFGSGDLEHMRDRIKSAKGA